MAPKRGRRIEGAKAASSAAAHPSEHHQARPRTATEGERQFQGLTVRSGMGSNAGSANGCSPALLARPASFTHLEVGDVVQLTLANGHAVDTSLHGAPLDYVVRERTDVDTLTFAFVLLVSRHLHVPEDCVSFIWEPGRRRTDASSTTHAAILKMSPVPDTHWPGKESIDDDSCAVCALGTLDRLSWEQSDAMCPRCTPMYL